MPYPTLGRIEAGVEVIDLRSITFTDGTLRPVHTDPDGRQWVTCPCCDEDGSVITGCEDCSGVGWVNGEWLPPDDGADEAVVVEV